MDCWEVGGEHVWPSLNKGCLHSKRESIFSGSL